MQHDTETAPRILLYAHDSFGLGHLRRSLTLAEALIGAFPRASILLVTGSPCATFFRCPAGVDIVKLPSVSKDDDGQYISRSLPGTLSTTLRLRRTILLESFREFDPELLIVDHQVVGLNGEVLPLLHLARERGTRTILGIRDIIDSPEAVAHEWGTADCRWALSNGYDRVCVYGTPEVYDTVTEYSFPPELSERAEFIGYVARDAGTSSLQPVPSMRPKVLVTMGGGEDGAECIQTFLECLELGTPTFDSVIVTGPLLEGRQARRLRRRARGIQGACVHRSHSDLPKQLADCAAVVSMAGYNTCAEILASGKPAVLLPRTRPRREQAIRATRLERLGLATALFDPHPSELRDAVETALQPGRPKPATPDLGGARRLCFVANELLNGRVRLGAASNVGSLGVTPAHGARATSSNLAS